MRMRPSSTTDKFKCNKCDLSFTASRALTQHLPSHSDQKPFICPFKPCERKYKRSRSLSDHIVRNHKEEKAKYAREGVILDYIVDQDALRIQVEETSNEILRSLPAKLITSPEILEKVPSRSQNVVLSPPTNSMYLVEEGLTEKDYNFLFSLELAPSFM